LNFEDFTSLFIGHHIHIPFIPFESFPLLGPWQKNGPI